MPPALAWTLLLVLGLALSTSGWLVARRGRRWAIVMAAFALLLVIGKCVITWFPTWEWALFPWADYAYLQGWWLYGLVALFLGLAIPQLPVRWNQGAVGLLAIGVIGYGAWEARWMLGLPQIGAAVGPAANHHLQQSTGYTCAPCSCAIALSYCGISTTEQEMAALCLTRINGGTTVFNTYRGLALKLAGTPWRARVVDTPVDQLLADGRIAVIDFPEILHALAVRGQGSTILVHDPLKPEPRTWAAEDFARMYGGTAIVIERRPIDGR